MLNGLGEEILILKNQEGVRELLGKLGLRGVATKKFIFLSKKNSKIFKKLKGGDLETLSAE